MPIDTNPTRAVTSAPTSHAERRARDGTFQSIVGASPRMQRIFRLVAKVARTDSTVLLFGESGTGKELVARSIHLQSRRSHGPFVAVNVGAIPETLMESELFGHVRGAFTDATKDRKGLIEEAERGTLFLDEIGDMPPSTQVKLLRTLENNEVRRIGDNVTHLVDVRVIAATHRDLLAEVATGRFREDLYYRLNVVQIEVPPLRERREDIGLLASYFLERVGARERRPGLRFSQEAEDLLERYDYPGNVRELENAVEHAVAVSEGPQLTAADLPPAVRAPRLLPRSVHSAVSGGRAHDAPEPSESTRAAPAEAHEFDRESEDAVSLLERDTWSLADVERDHIRRVLRFHHGNATAAARQLGVSRTTLWRKLREYGIERKQ
jgi:DNA-binding NtrC family response regulator